MTNTAGWPQNPLSGDIHLLLRFAIQSSTLPRTLDGCMAAHHFVDGKLESHLTGPSRDNEGAPPRVGRVGNAWSGVNGLGHAANHDAAVSCAGRMLGDADSTRTESTPGQKRPSRDRSWTAGATWSNWGRARCPSSHRQTLGTWGRLTLLGRLLVHHRFPIMAGVVRPPDSASIVSSTARLTFGPRF